MPQQKNLIYIPPYHQYHPTQKKERTTSKPIELYKDNTDFGTHLELQKIWNSIVLLDIKSNKFPWYVHEYQLQIPAIQESNGGRPGWGVGVVGLINDLKESMILSNEGRFHGSLQ